MISSMSSSAKIGYDSKIGYNSRCVPANEVDRCEWYEPPVSARQLNCFVFEGACYKDSATGHAYVIII